MQTGFSRELFIQWASNPKNCIILTNRTAPPTLARQLIDYPNKGSVKLEVRRRVRLEGKELEEHQRKQKERKAEAAKQKADQAKRERDELESSDESDEDGENDTVTSRGRHDLMVKAEGKGRSGFFKQVKKSHPMFPMKEEKIKWDEYGEIIRHEDYVIKETAPTEEEKMETGGEEKAAVEEKKDVPTKCVSSTETLELRANILYIDFEGRSDGESMRKILAQIKPRQLILVRGSPESTQSLAQYCRTAKDVVQGKVHVPKLMELLDATTESHIFQVRLKDSVVSALRFSKAKDAEIAWLDGGLDLSAAKTDTSAVEEGKEGYEESMETGEESDLVPVLVPASHIHPHTAVFVNEPKLSDFKQILVNQGFQAEFSAGVLICNNVLAVKRNEAGRLQLEGTLCEDYYNVRQLLYEQFAIV